MPQGNHHPNDKEEKYTMTDKHIAVVTLGTEPPHLPGQTVKVGKGKDKIDPDSLPAYIAAGQITTEQTAEKEGK